MKLALVQMNMKTDIQKNLDKSLQYCDKAKVRIWSQFQQRIRKQNQWRRLNGKCVFRQCITRRPEQYSQRCFIIFGILINRKISKKLESITIKKHTIICQDYLNFMSCIAYFFHYIENIENIFMNGVKSALSMDLRRIVSGEEVVLALVRIIQKKLQN